MVSLAWAGLLLCVTFTCALALLTLCRAGTASEERDDIARNRKRPSISQTENADVTTSSDAQRQQGVKESRTRGAKLIFLHCWSNVQQQCAGVCGREGEVVGEPESRDIIKTVSVHKRQDRIRWNRTRSANTIPMSSSVCQTPSKYSTTKAPMSRPRNRLEPTVWSPRQASSTPIPSLLASRETDLSQTEKHTRRELEQSCRET